MRCTFLVMNTPRTTSPSDRTTLRRRGGRSQDVTVLDGLLDETLLCHVAVVVNGAPAVLPTSFVRIDDNVFVHGAVGNHLLRSAIGAEVCFTATCVDAWVFSKSAAHHSVNYRCAVAFGVGVEVTSLDEKRTILDALLNKMQPGRADVARPSTERELRAVLVVRIPLDEASCKQRSGPPSDDAEDLAWPAWRGLVPVALTLGTPVTC
jgi:uncharacterized protein